MALSQNSYIIIGVVVLVVSLAVGFIIGHFTVSTGPNTSEKKTLDYYRSLLEDSEPNGLKELVKNVNTETLKNNLL